MRLGSPIATALCAVLLTARLSAELPSPRLDTIFPPGARAGSAVEVNVTGAELGEASALRFSHPGISATKVDKHFAVKVAPEVPPGFYEARVSGTPGVSNPRAFVVSDLPETVKTKVNSSRETAVDFPIDSVIAGSVTAANADFFKFTAQQGQRLIFECAAAEIDSRLSPVLAVLDSAGQELEVSRRGGLLDFTAPAEGAYLLRLNDLTFAGGAEHFYRLAITTRPHVDFAFPPCVAPGVKSKVTLFGRNLPGGVEAKITGADGKGLQKLNVEIDAPATPDAWVDGFASPLAAGADGFAYRLKTTQGAANPVFISFASALVVTEQEPNNSPAKAQQVTVPCEIAGQFFAAGDVDCFTFDVKKGDVWRIEVLSHRLGLPTNPFLLVEREGAAAQEVYGSAANVGTPRFSTLSNDPATRLEVKEDGAYRVQVRDLFGASRRDPRNVYRLSIRKESPGFRLAAVVEPPPEKKDERTAAPRGAVIREGGTTAIRVVAFRRDSFAGDIELCADGLPSGVKCIPTKILAGKDEGYLLLTAEEKVERWVGPIRITGKSRVGEAEIVQEARGGAVLWTVADFNNDPVRARFTRDFVVAVGSAEPAPITVQAAEDKVWEAAAGAKLEIPLKVTRRGEFKEALKLSAAGAPAIDKAKDIDIDAKAESAKATIDLAAAKIPAGEHTIYFQTLTKGKFRGKETTTTIFSAPIRIVVK